MTGFIRGTLVDDAAVAQFWAVVARTPTVRGLIAVLPLKTRIAVEASIHAFASTARPGSVAAEGNAETETAALDACSSTLDTREAAELLGLTPRRVRQLAAGGLGRRVAGRWALDSSTVDTLRRTRESSGNHQGQAPGS